MSETTPVAIDTLCPGVGDEAPEAPPRPASEDPFAETDESAPQSLWSLLGRIKRAFVLAKAQKGAVLLILALTLVLSGMSAVEPLVMRFIIDALGRRDTVTVLLCAVGVLLGLGVGREAVGSWSNWLTWRTRLRLQYALLDLLVERIHRLPQDVHRKEGVGAIMTRMDRSISGLIGAISDLSFNVLPAYLYLVMALIIMLKLDWRLTVLMLSFAPVPVWIAGLAAPAQKRREKLLFERWARIYSRFNEVLSGIVTVRSFAMEDHEKRRFIGDVGRANGVVLRGVRYDSLVGASQNLAVLLARIFAIAAGGIMVVRGEITLGTLIAFLGYLGGLFGPVQSLTGIYRNLRTASVSVDQVFAILDARDALADAPDAVDPSPVRGDVVFDAVRFAYPSSGEVLKGVSFEARPGEVVAVVGPSGSGKSTMMALLQRFHDPTGGAIRLDGRDLRRLRQKDLRRNIGVVLQDALLFNEPVREGIAYGRPGATLREIEHAAVVANAHEFIRRLEDGYDTMAGERGCRFSVGERQRIAIARAILKDPAILILDEATSALDAETEWKVQEALDRLIRGRTTFVIAHRLATVVKADRILVLRKGLIVESGRHEDLVKKGGYYASLVRRQVAGLLIANGTNGEAEAVEAGAGSPAAERPVGDVATRPAA